jgi:signal transduction histidine kinase
MFSHLINIQYCYDYLINQISVGLLLYAHLPAAILATFFGVYLLLKTRKLEGVTLFVVCISFAIWCFLSLTTWFSFLGSANTMFTWSLIDLFALIFFSFSYYFLYTFITKKDLPLWQKTMGLLTLLPTIIWTFFGSNLTGYDANFCEAVENNTVTIYPYVVGAIYLLIVIIFAIIKYRKENARDKKKEIMLVSLGIGIFLFFFLSSTFLVNILVNNDLLAGYAYNYEIYGLFGMPLLLAFLGYLVVRYKAFNLKVFGAQALILTLVALIGSQFFFIQSNTNRILTGVTLVILGFVGINLMRSVKREIESREKIEKLAGDLERANDKLKELDQLKSEFLSLATHQIRAPLTAVKGYSSMLLEGDFGVLPEKAKDSLKIIMKSCQNLINIVGDFLNISRIEQGRMVYEKSIFDIAELAKEVLNELKPNVETAGLSLEISIPENSPMKVNADKGKVKQIIGNIIDNAIKYTIKGGINISVFEEQGRVKIAVKDSGVGIDQSEINKLFNKFSRAREASKTNVHGTGLGLYIAKKMAEAQGGDIKISSLGLGHGTTFTIEFPAVK